jgi:hypothetical protein
VVELVVSEELADLRTNENTLLDFFSTDSWEFLSEVLNAGPV